MAHTTEKIWLCAAAAWLLYFPTAAVGTPQTYFDTAASIEAPIASGRFGASMDCSLGSENSGTSYIAVGAPEADSGAGAVYIYQAGSSPSLVQTITRPGSTHFGSSLAFVPDFNLDGKQELIIGELHYGFLVYQSFSPATPFTICTSVLAPTPGFARNMSGLSPNITTTLRLLVGAPDSNQVRGYSFSYVHPFCTATEVGNYSGPSTGTEFGAALSETSPSHVGVAQWLVGAPLSINGGVFLSDPSSSTAIESNSGENRFGTAVAAHRDSDLIAYSNREATSGSGYVVIQDTGVGAPLYCSVLSTETATDFGKALRHLADTSFSSVIQAGATTFAGYRDESATGGSVAIFGQYGLVCPDSEYQYNNCQNDPNQEQGSVLSGGLECQAQIGGSTKSLLLVGSPGWSSNQGRIDIVAQDSDHINPTACFSGGGGGGEDDPIQVSPGSGNLPAPIVTTSGNSATITTPLVTPTLSPAQRSKALAKLIKMGLSKKKANAALKKLVVTYVISVTSTQSASSGSDEISNQASSITRRSKRNTLTLNNLGAGARQATWRVEISTKNPRVLLGKTKNSSSTRFTIGSSG